MPICDGFEACKKINNLIKKKQAFDSLSNDENSENELLIKGKGKKINK